MSYSSYWDFTEFLSQNIDKDFQHLLLPWDENLGQLNECQLKQQKEKRKYLIDNLTTININEDFKSYIDWIIKQLKNELYLVRG